MPVSSDAALAPFRFVGDPPTDALVAASAPGPIAAWIADRGPLPPGLAPWLEETAQLPPWADPARVERGQRVFSRVAVQAMVALLCRGLPECYAAGDGATLLMLSGRVVAAPRRRIMETARFLLAVMDPGRLAVDARIEAQKVRLVHGLARRHIRANPDYRVSLGVPVNQEDMVGTLLAFSSLVMDAMPDLGIELPERDIEDYLHAWRVIGALSGVDDRLLPASHAEAQTLMARIRRRHFRASPAGRAMNGALVEMLEELVSALPPRRVATRAPAALMRWLLPDGVADLLDVPRVPGHRVLGGAVWGLGRLAQRAVLDPHGELWEPLGRAIFEMVYRYGSEGERPRFAPPGVGLAA